MSLVETVNLCQRYGEKDILKNINLKVERGETFALIGPTGSGKTTLLRLLNLLDSPASGEIFIDGTAATKSLAMRTELRRRMAFVLQKPVVFNMNVYDNIACVLRWRRESKSVIRQKVAGVLEMVSLHDYRMSNARTLSGGQVQMVALARAIVSQPELLLLDEPTANLDPASVSKVETLIRDVINRHNTTVIMATHDMVQGQRLADRVGVLLEGEIRQSGDWHQVFHFPQDRTVASFVGTENIVDGIIVARQDELVTVDVGGKVVEAISDCPVGEKVSLCIRPEDIILARARASSSARNSFAGEITRILSFGALRQVEINCGLPLVALITKRSAEELELDTGKQVFASFKATGVHVIKPEPLPNP